MSSMPDDGAGRQQGNRQGTVGPDVPAQPGAQDATRQQSAPQQDSHGQAPYDQAPYSQAPYDQAQYDQAPYSQAPYDQAQYRQSPYDRPAYGQLAVVPEAETKVTGRRVVQYIIDYVLAGIIPALAYWLFDRSNGSIRGFGWLVATVIALAVYFVYWVVIPHAHRGQTFGMQLTRIHVISKNGEKASMLQLFVRGIFLIIDTFIWGLVGFITILCSKHRQRIGDHVAKTVVVPVKYGPQI